MIKKLEVLQEDKNDCAAACLSSIIKYYNGYLPLEDIRNLIKTDKLGTNAYDFIEGAKEIGFDIVPKKITFEEIESMQDKLPVVAHMKKGNYYHFIVIYDIYLSKNKALIMDPALGFRKVDLQRLKEDFLGTIIILSKVKELPKLNKNNHFLKVMTKVLLEDKKRLVLISFMSFIMFIFNLVEILFYRCIFDNVNIAKDIIYIILIVVIHKNIIALINNILFIRTKYSLDINMNHETLNRLFNLPYNYYKNKTTGEIISRINDLDKLKDLFLEIMTESLMNILLVLSTLLIIVHLNVYVFIIVLIVLFCYLFVTFIMNNKYKRKIRLIQEYKGLYSNNLIETLEAIETINNLGIKNNRNTLIESNYKNFVYNNMNLSKMTITERFVKDFIYDISLILIMMFSIFSVLNNDFSIGEVMLIYMLYSYFMNTVKSMLDKVPEITFAFNNLEKVSQILVDNNKSNNDNLVKGGIKVKKLSYESNGCELFNNLSFNIKEKSKVFIKGKSGTGKSTLLKILLKYTTDYKGDIYIDNVNYRDIDSNLINNSFTYIGQNEKLFTDTLINNLILDRNIDRNEVDKVIKICEIDEIMNTRKLKEDFFIEEDGFNLSGGERQRIILARGLLKKGNYLLLDESLSEVDVSKEKRIIRNILDAYRDITVIYVSHKLETSDLFEEIIDIERRSNNE